jgi:hypothetical protein
VTIIAFRYSDGEAAILPGRDRQGVTGNPFLPLVFADGDATPVNQSKYSTPLYPVPNYLGKKGLTGDLNSTIGYYE